MRSASAGSECGAKSLAASPVTPIVLVTGWGHGMRAESDLPAHVDRLLSKPPAMEQLRKAITELTAAPVT